MYFRASVGIVIHREHAQKNKLQVIIKTIGNLCSVLLPSYYLLTLWKPRAGQNTSAFWPANKHKFNRHNHVDLR